MIWAEPGVSPIRKPSTEPRAIGIADCRHSCALGNSSRRRGAITLRTACADGVDTPDAFWIRNRDRDAAAAAYRRPTFGRSMKGLQLQPVFIKAATKFPDRLWRGIAEMLRAAKNLDGLNARRRNRR